MAKIEKRQVCKCENCGNEAEMVVTCTLPEDQDPSNQDSPESRRVKGSGICSHCGNEADMWLDL